MMTAVGETIYRSVAASPGVRMASPATGEASPSVKLTSPSSGDKRFWLGEATPRAGMFTPWAGVYMPWAAMCMPMVVMFTPTAGESPPLLDTIATLAGIIMRAAGILRLPAVEATPWYGEALPQGRRSGEAKAWVALCCKGASRVRPPDAYAQLRAGPPALDARLRSGT